MSSTTPRKFLIVSIGAALGLAAGVGTPVVSRGDRPPSSGVLESAGNPSEAEAQHRADVETLRKWYVECRHDDPGPAAQRLEQWVKDHPGDGESAFLVSKIYRPAALRGDPEAKHRCDALLKAGAAAGYAPAMAHWGLMMMMSNGTPRDSEAGFALVKKALEQDDAEAHLIYGCVLTYRLDGGVPKYEEALQHLKIAADRGLVRAYARLFVCYDKMGQGADKMELLHKGAAAGDPQAQQDLCECYARGRHVPRDLMEAERWGKMAAESGDPESQRILGEVYAAINDGTPTRALEEARYWFQLASDGGDMKARYWVGLSLINMVGTPIGDAEKGMQLLREAAQAEQRDAQFTLGEQYFLGGLVERDLKEARRWLQKARVNGHQGAENLLRWIDVAERRELSSPTNNR